MSEQDDQTKMLLLMAMLALWASAWGYSLIYALTVVPEGDGFTRGLNRVSGFLGWQGVAGMIAVACWGVGRGFPLGSGIRRTSNVPVWLALLLLVGVFLTLAWSMLSHP